MGELDYVGFLAMLWIGFVFFAIYMALKRANQIDFSELTLLSWLTAFWRLPVGIFHLVFGRKLPDWMGPVIWLAPAYLTVIIKYSAFYKFGDGWGFSIGQLAIIWFS
ncbi:MAG: hypothetical protein ACTH58_04830 [Marinomonas foliarum]|uniref:hypothetical protein n=1 Tax=Marinomonas foliarum TaxID=491950 RepID=UPI003F9CD96C